MIEFSNLASLTKRALLTTGVLAACSCALWAQYGGGGMRQRGNNNLERELQQLTEVLALNQAQQSQVWTLLKERRRQMQALRRSARSDQADEAPGANFQQALAILQDCNAKIRALLNDDQKAKFDDWQEQRMERWSNRRGEGAPAAAPAPAPAPEPAPQPPGS